MTTGFAGLLRRLTSGRGDAAGERVELARGERVLATARDAHTDAVLVATTARLVVSAPVSRSAHAAAPVMSRRWHEVDAGSWEPQTGTISVTWVDGSRAAQWSLGESGTRFSAVFYERVAASVLIDAALEVPDGDEQRQVGRVALRRNLGTSDIVKQTVWARSVRRDDPDLHAYADRVLADLAEQAGLT